MKWSPPGRRKRGRPKLTWAEGIRGLMGLKGLMEEDWNDRDNWRRKKYIAEAHLATTPQHIPTQHDMLPQHLVCKYQSNCEYYNITLARN